MLYKDFNKSILDHYVLRSTSNFCSLTTDKLDLERILPLEIIKCFPELTSTWDDLLIDVDGIPQYFGLLSIQCYAASIMHDDGNNASDAYRIRLKQLLGIEDDSILYSLFRGRTPQNPIQEQIWLCAKQYLAEKFGLLLLIPKRLPSANRFVQFPKSQSLLTTGDLHSFTAFFSEEFNLGESIPFDYFKQRLQSNFINIDLPKKAKDLFADPLKQERCYGQVYSYFNSWDGSIVERKTFNKKDGAVKGSSALSSRDSLLLIFEGNQPIFYLKQDSNDKAIQQTDPVNLFGPGTYKTFYDSIHLFVEMDDYENEYEDSRFLIYDMVNYIVLDTTTRFNEYNILKRICGEPFRFNEKVFMYKYTPSFKKEYNILDAFFHVEKKLSLIGGLRISRQNKYLTGYGPAIVSNYPYRVYYNHQISTYNGESSAPGNYTVRIDNCKDTVFQLIDADEPDFMNTSRKSGWDIKAYNYSSTTFQIEGCAICIPANTWVNPVRAWIDTNLGKKYRGKNPFVKAINNAVQ